MSEKSGIEILKELQADVFYLKRQFAVIEQTMKLILSKMEGGVQMPISQVNNPVLAPPPTPQLVTKTESQTDMAKVMGKIKHKGKALIGVAVKITNSQLQVVKDTKTNRAGDWMCFLPPGTYKAEYQLDGILNASVNFKISSGQKLLRVAQPVI